MLTNTNIETHVHGPKTTTFKIRSESGP